MDSATLEAPGMERQLTTRRDTSVHCVACDRAVPRKMRGQKYCSRRCRNRKNNQQRVRKAFLGRDTRGEATPTKSSNKINGLQNQIWRPSLGISASLTVIHGELFAGCKWEQVTSADGVTCFILRRASR